VEGEPRVVVIPAEVGWSDIGSWAAVHGLLLDKELRGRQRVRHSGLRLDARGNLVSCPGKIAALIGVHDLIVVDTPDALLICPRERARNVENREMARRAAAERPPVTGQSAVGELFRLAYTLHRHIWTPLSFGTDGWRGIIAEDFTFANARVVAQSIARYVVRCEDARKGVIIGYDHRFASMKSPRSRPTWFLPPVRPFFLTDKPAPLRQFPCSCGNAERPAA